MELLFNKSNEILNEIQVNTDGRWQVDSGGNQNELEISKELDLDSSKDNSAPRLPTPDETPELNFETSLLLPAEFLSTSVNKKLYYVMVPAKEAKPKKKINSDVGE